MSARLASTNFASLLKDELVLAIESEIIVKIIARIFSDEDLINFLKMIHSVNIVMQKKSEIDSLLANQLYNIP